jgi:parallel beta-helix repeat protein
MTIHKNFGVHTLRKSILIVVLTILFANVVSSKEIDSCQTISSPGDYMLNTSITNSSLFSCINITSNDVIFDGAGFAIDGTATSGTKGVYVYNSTNVLTNVTVKNLKVTDWYYGIYYIKTQNGTLSWNSASSNIYGILLSQSNYNNLTHNTASLNNPGIMLYQSSHNSLTNNTAISNAYGIDLSSSNFNIITGNNASSNSDNGIILFAFGFTGNYNIVYNNYFNNTNNSRILSLPNTWNTTKKPGINIIGGPYLGGNFWAKPDGTGFSQTCEDSNGDGICDSSYVLYGNNIDYLPLANKQGKK